MENFDCVLWGNMKRYIVIVTVTFEREKPAPCCPCQVKVTLIGLPNCRELWYSYLTFSWCNLHLTWLCLLCFFLLTFVWFFYMFVFIFFISKTNVGLVSVESYSPGRSVRYGGSDTNVHWILRILSCAEFSMLQTVSLIFSVSCEHKCWILFIRWPSTQLILCTYCLLPCLTQCFHRPVFWCCI